MFHSMMMIIVVSIRFVIPFDDDSIRFHSMIPFDSIRFHSLHSNHEHEGIWVGVLPGEDVPDYRVEVTYDDGIPTPSTTPTGSCRPSARWTSHLVNEGRHQLLWTVLGARVHHYQPPLGEPVTGMWCSATARTRTRPTGGRR